MIVSGGCEGYVMVIGVALLVVSAYMFVYMYRRMVRHASIHTLNFTNPEYTRGLVDKRKSP